MLLWVIVLCLYSCVCAEICDIDCKLIELREQLESRYDARIEHLQNQLKLQQDKNHKQDEEIQAQREVIRQMRETMNKLTFDKREIEPSTKSYYASFGCLADELTLSCPNGRTIFVTSADYGQYYLPCDTECCPPHPYDCIELMSTSNSDEWLLLKLACDNQTSCTYLYQGSTFVEDCAPEALADYIAVYYSCLPEDVTEQVGFSAYSTGEHLYYNDELILFTDIESNYGNYYNVESSTFICPHDGIYIFLVNIFPASGYEMFVSLMEESGVLFRIRADSNADFSDRFGASNSVITDCSRGDKVWVKCEDDTNKPSTTHRLNSFSGYLLYRYA